MAPEILVKSRRLGSASFESLKKVDMWAFGMVLFNLVNPDLKYPFQLDIMKQAPMLDQLNDILQQQRQPSDSSKYTRQRETIWASLSALRMKCIVFDPDARPTSSETMDELIVINLLSMDSGTSLSSSNVNCERYGKNIVKNQSDIRIVVHGSFN